MILRKIQVEKIVRVVIVSVSILLLNIAGIAYLLTH